MSRRVTRRSLLKTSAAAGAAFMAVKSGVLAAGRSPNDRLNIAGFGVGGRGHANLNDCRKENIVALCDVNGHNLAAAARRFPNARKYVDWRKCLEQTDVDAVICSTTDHTHAFINIWAMNRGMHVYCEKPLANSVEEAALVRQTYLAHKDKIATQMGTQIHACDNYRRMVELVRRGAIGAVREAHVWCGRTPAGGSYLPEAGPVPDHVDWDLWIGPAPFHPFNPEYLKSCLSWNFFWDFGSGQIGDMGSHMLDMPWWALDLRFPTTCEAAGSPVNPDTCPQWLTAVWEHPANDWRPAVKVFWYDADKKPKINSEAVKGDLFKGVMYVGDKGKLFCDYDFRVLEPAGDLTYFTPPKPEELIPSSPGHHQEWIDAAKTGAPTLCNFDYAGTLIMHNLLALVAYRVGKKLEWDAAALTATNCPEAERFIRKKYREGWTLNG